MNPAAPLLEAEVTSPIKEGSAQKEAQIIEVETPQEQELIAPVTVTADAEAVVEVIVEENASKEIVEAVQSPAKIDEVLSAPLVEEKEV